jgi:uncharacterized protein
MDCQLLGRHGDVSDYALIFETGDSVVIELERFAGEHDVGAASFFALGAFSSATLAYFAWESKEYEDLEVDEQVEVVSLSGNIGREGTRARLHLHAVLGRRDGSVVAGHLKDGVVRPTLELFLRSYPGILARVQDEESGLASIRPSGGPG